MPNPDPNDLVFTYIGGPTALLELAGIRFLTDPTFDPAGSEYRTSVYILRKHQDPAINPVALGSVDVVLLSHDHHFDNLDNAGRAFLASAKTVLTTSDAASRLGDRSLPLANSQTFDILAPGGRILRVTGTPARHGPADGDRGPVTGFMLNFADKPEASIYVSGDTVWYDGVAELSQQFGVKVAVLFMGAARVKEVGPAHLTMSAEDGIEFARAFPSATIVPLHYEGWEHFSESRNEIQHAFEAAGCADRLLWLQPGVRTALHHWTSGHSASRRVAAKS